MAVVKNATHATRKIVAGNGVDAKKTPNVAMTVNADVTDAVAAEKKKAPKK
ncbi:MAG: hypothetical protein JW725_01875 [Candidatus Babeliaceae bacterium]|nr:hypothetical protein [Candidatus Babeliaceae bacterium]